MTTPPALHRPGPGREPARDVQPAASAPGERVCVLERRRGLASLGLAELWESRELVLTLAGRDVSVRYRQTLLGAAWAVLQPLAAMAVFALFFGRLAGIPSDGVPYAPFALAALVPWTYFANAVTASSSSLIDNRALLTKVYFPRLVLPLVPLVSGLVDLAISLAMLVVLVLGHGRSPGPELLALPGFVLLALLTAAAAGLWLAALSALYRDFRHVVPFLVQFWLFATPVVYSSRLVPEGWRALYGLNPMAGVVEGFRWAVLGLSPPGGTLVVSAAVAALGVVSGALVFRHLERTLEDVL